MADVETEITVKWRGWAYDEVDKGLPSGVWFAQGAIIGDASGGHAEVAILLNAGAAGRSGQLWSIEVSMPTVAADTQDRVFRMNSINLDAIGPGQGNPIQKAYTQIMDQVSGGIDNPRSAVAAENLFPGVFLGSQSASNSPATLQGQTDNIDTLTFAWYASGYVWSPGAVNAPGGLRRPLGGVF